MSDTMREAARLEASALYESEDTYNHPEEVMAKAFERGAAWQAAQSQPAPPSQPSNATWKTVPSEPDKLMLVKGENALHSSSHGDFHATEGEIEACYLAMLEAAPAPPVPASVQEIMPLVNAYVRACGEFLISGDDSAEEALKPLQAALTALVDDNHRLKFELDGVNAMRGPLTHQQMAKAFVAAQIPEDATCTCEHHLAIADVIQKALGIEPEQGGNHGNS